jgi:general secretion pathway protein K
VNFVSPKNAPFEAVAELQDFAPLAGIPLKALYALFTVNSKRGTVSIEHAPKRLREQFEATANLPVTQEAATLSTFTVAVAVRRKTSDIEGRAGFVLQERPDGTSMRLGRFPDEAIDTSDPGPQANGGSCARLFGSAVEKTLEEWRS